MSRRRPVSPRAMGQVLVAVALVLLVMVGITWLQRSAPGVIGTPLPAIAEGLPDVEVVTCERTLPEADDQDPEFIAGPVGLITSASATSCPRRFEGRVVGYVGEVVGEVLHREGGAWVQVNDDAYALKVGPLPAHREFAGTNSGLAVWLPGDLHTVVERPGRRGLRGDVIAVEGVFHRVDPDDGGGLTIRATSASRVAPAQSIEQPLHVPQAIAALVGALLAIGAVWRERWTRHHHHH